MQREQLALEATAAGLLPVMLDCAARHKSATVVAAIVKCLQALCQASASTRDAIGKITGKLRHQQQSPDNVKCKPCVDPTLKQCLLLLVKHLAQHPAQPLQS